MEGNGDPANRAPMRWDLATTQNPVLVWERRLINLRKTHAALRIGDYTPLQSSRLLAFARTTDKVRDTVFVIVNPTDQPVKETFGSRVGKIMSWGDLRDQLSTDHFPSINGLIKVDMPPKSIRILTPITDPMNGYSPYDRVP
jgi:cyclomaltodextrinase / maltogenic alpha-amylase / neopullulanase